MTLIFGKKWMMALTLPALLLAAFWSSAPAYAQSISLIRDAEIENMIRDFATPIWKAAGLQADNIKVHIVDDTSINAFAAAGQQIFVNTGLIIQAKTPNQIIGVLAHETGHIAGGHLVRSEDAMKSATSIALASLLAGLGAVVAGAGDAGAAIMLSSQEFAGRNYLAYSRTQESSADQAGLTFLAKSGQSARGLIELFQMLGQQESLITKDQDPYVQSHPLTPERIAALQNAAEKSPYWNTPDTPENIEHLKRAKAKIMGYMEPARALQKYPADDPSPSARYARAFAYYRQSQADEALKLINGLISEEPETPYFYELKGQILFESGKAKEAEAPIEKAISLMPQEPLFRILYAQTMLSTDDKAAAQKVVDNLKIASLYEKEDPTIWALLAQAYHVVGNEPMADLSTAEQYLLVGQTGSAVQLAARASHGLPHDTPSWWRAQDIVYIAQSNGVGQNRRGSRR